MMNRLSDRLKKSPIARNGAPKLVSLLFAVLLWIYVMDVENPEMLKVVKNVDISITGTEMLESDNLVLLSSTFPGIDVTIKGRRSEVNSIDRSDIRLTANVSGLGQGEHSVVIERSVNFDTVTVMALSRRTVDVTLDKLSEQLKPVDITFKGPAKPGFLTEAAVPDPPMILVTGPDTLVKQIVSLRGEVDSASITAMTEAQIPIRPVDSAGKTVEGVTTAAKSVKATLSLFQVKSLTVNPALLGKVMDGFQLIDVKISPATVSLKGPEALLNDFTILKTKPINLTGMSESDTVNVELDLPVGIVATELSVPLKAVIRIEAVKVRELTYNPDEISFINSASGTSGRMLGPFKIRIRGIESLVDALRKDDIKIRVDLAGQPPGRVNANILYDVGVKYSDVQIDPSQVEVDIEVQ